MERTPVVAAFDLDGTLTTGGSVFRWLRVVAGDRVAYEAALRLGLPLVNGALRSGTAADQAKERLFRALLAGRDLDQVTAVSRFFILAHLAAHRRNEVVARLEWHRARGDDVVIVSASPQIYVDVVAEQVGADGAIGTRLAVDTGGRLTGGYDGLNCRGEEKLRRTREWMSQREYDRTPEVFAYGNSRGDRRLLASADHPFDVGRLGPLGALRRYPRLGTDWAVQA
ncbi:MAG TPA: HAD-IB family hydrolase [Acidimicrobiales bacterium]|nr:HAD-IB family hydrolase [Acidimicrobiales bacterium]